MDRDGLQAQIDELAASQPIDVVVGLTLLARARDSGTDEQVCQLEQLLYAEERWSQRALALMSRAEELEDECASLEGPRAEIRDQQRELSDTIKLMFGENSRESRFISTADRIEMIGRELDTIEGGIESCLSEIVGELDFVETTFKERIHASTRRRKFRSGMNGRDQVGANASKRSLAMLSLVLRNLAKFLFICAFVAADLLSLIVGGIQWGRWRGGLDLVRGRPSQMQQVMLAMWVSALVCPVIAPWICGTMLFAWTRGSGCNDLGFLLFDAYSDSSLLKNPEDQGKFQAWVTDHLKQEYDSSGQVVTRFDENVCESVVVWFNWETNLGSLGFGALIVYLFLHFCWRPQQ